MQTRHAASRTDAAAKNGERAGVMAAPPALSAANITNGKRRQPVRRGRRLWWPKKQKRTNGHVADANSDDGGGGDTDDGEGDADDAVPADDMSTTNSNDAMDPQIRAVLGFNVVQGQEMYLVEWGNTGRCTWEPYLFVHTSHIVRTYRRALVGRAFEEQHKDDVQSGHRDPTILPRWIKQMPSHVNVEIRRDESGTIEGFNALTLMTDYLTKSLVSHDAASKLKSNAIQRDITCGCLVKTDESEAYDRRKLLRDSYKYDTIYECTNACECPPDCTSRVVQMGQVTKVELFYTSKCGWGVRADQDIAKGAFVVEYTGEIITNAEANERGMSDPSRTYLFNLSAINREAEFVIDATRWGNYSRFFNHSCDPNLRAISVFTTELDQRIHHVAFFAQRDIKKGEELTFDYKPSPKQWIPSSDTIWLRCHCDKPSCRKFLFFY